MPRKTKDLDLEKTSTTSKKTSSINKKSLIEKSSEILKNITKSSSKKVNANIKQKEVEKSTMEDNKITTLSQPSITKIAQKQSEKKISRIKTSTKKTVTRKSTNPKKIQNENEEIIPCIGMPVENTIVENTTNSLNTFSPEYYDLPYRYNQTIVKILAQTPTNLFIYWDISDEDRNSLKQQYGKYFFEITKPVLIVHNKTLGYSFEVEINDFANSWYLEVNDSDSEYKIELGRRPIPINYNYIPSYNAQEEPPIKPIEVPYIFISSSNEIISPNNKILFNLRDKVYFKNIKTNEIIERNIQDFKKVYHNGKFINIYDLYKELYSNLFNEDFSSDKFNLKNPSSGNLSSGSFSSRFK